MELIACRRQRRTPYLYSPSDITRLVGAAASLRPALRGATYEALFGLLSCTGMRVGETIALDRGDVDLRAGELEINDAKFRKHRRLPLHGSTVAALRRYAEVRDRLCPRPKVPSFFVSTRGTRLLYVCVNEVFRKLVEDTGLAAQPGAGRPRIHDLRHGFATASVQDFHRSGADPAGQAPGALGLSRPCRSRLHLHLPPCLSGAARIGGKTARALRRRPAMSALAPTVQAWFTEHLLTQRQASPRTVAAYRDTLRMLLAFAQARTGKAPSQLDVADVDATLDRRLPHPSRAGSAQQRPHPQRPPGRHPLALPLCRPSPSRARPADPARPGHPGQATRSQRRQLPPTRGGRCAAGRAGPEHPDRKARSCPAGARRPDRPARQRADRPRLR